MGTQGSLALQSDLFPFDLGLSMGMNISPEHHQGFTQGTSPESVASVDVRNGRVPWLLVGATLVGAVAIAVVINLRTTVPDSYLGLDVSPSGFLGYMFHAWSANDLGQQVNGSTITYLPIALLYAGLHSVGLPMLQIQQVWFGLVMAGSAVGMLALYRCLWSDPSPLRAMAAGFLYGFSPYMLLNLKGASVLLIPYAVLPWLCLEVILVVRHHRIRHIVGSVIFGAILAPGVNPPLNALMFFAVGVVAIGELVRQRWSRDSVTWLVVAGMLVLAGSMWWIGPFVNGVRAGGASSYFVTDPLTMDAANSSFRAVLRLTGLWALYQGWGGTPYYPSQSYLLSTTIVVQSLLAPVIAFVVMRRFWTDIRVKVLAVLVLVAVPLAVSIYPVGHSGLTGQLYLWAYTHIFIFRAFRSTYKLVWLLAFSYSLLVPKSLLWVFRRQTHEGLAAVWKGAMLAAVTGLVVVYTMPFARGEVFPASYRIGTIPSYWYQASKWLDQQPGPGRVLFLPTQGFSDYNWGNPSGDIASLLMHRPEITPTLGVGFNSQTQKLLSLLADEASTKTSSSFAKALSLLGVRYVVQRNDVNWRYSGSPSPKQMQAFLNAQPSLKLVATFGKLEIYEAIRPSHSQVGVASAVETVVSDQGFSSSLNTWQQGNLARLSSAAVINPAIRAFQASSVWNDINNQYGPQMAFDDSPQVAWVSNVAGGVGQWIQADFTRPRQIHLVTVIARRDGTDALPLRLRISAGKRSVVTKMGASGVVRVDLQGVKSSSLRVTILASGPGGPNVGISEIKISQLPPNKVAYPALSAHGPSRYLFDFAGIGTGRLAHVVAAGPARQAKLTGSIQAEPMLSNASIASYLVPVGVTSVTASSQFGGLSAYSPLWTIAGDPAMDWVSNVPGGVGQWIQFNFPTKRWIGRISIRGRNDGVDAEATTVGVSVGGKFLGRRHLAWNRGGTATISINSRARTLRLTILSYQSGHTSRNVGFSEIKIPGVGVKRNMAALSAPKLLLNGHPVSLKVSASSATPVLPSGVPSLDDALASGMVGRAFTARLKLAAGQDSFRLAQGSLMGIRQSTLAVGHTASARIRWLPVQQVRNGKLKARIPSGNHYLLLDETADPLWQAHIGGHALTSVGVANAYGKLWRIPVQGGRVELTFNSLRSKQWLLDWAAMFSGTCALGIVLWRRKRLHARSRCRDEVLT